MAFEENKSSRRDEALIPNTQIETMFMRVCDDEQMTKYKNLIEEGHISLATAYASNIVYRLFFALLSDFEQSGRSIENLGRLVKTKGAKEK